MSKKYDKNDYDNSLHDINLLSFPALERRFLLFLRKIDKRKIVMSKLLGKIRCTYTNKSLGRKTEMSKIFSKISYIVKMVTLPPDRNNGPKKMIFTACFIS